MLATSRPKRFNLSGKGIIMFYSFEEFQATGQAKDDLGPFSSGLDLTGVTGRLYLDTLWIEQLDDGQWWTMGHGFDECKGALADCERFLYDFAIGNGNFTSLCTTETLTDALTEYCASEGLPQQCAMELLHETLTDGQRTWLSDFVKMWDAIEEHEDFEHAVKNRG